jgi:hypothetical protein
MNDGDIIWLRYVPFRKIRAYEALGWVLDSPMSSYSVIMRWEGAGDPVEPK